MKGFKEKCKELKGNWKGFGKPSHQYSNQPVPQARPSTKPAHRLPTAFRGASDTDPWTARLTYTDPLVALQEVGARTLLGAPGLTTRNKNATRNKGHRY